MDGNLSLLAFQAFCPPLSDWSVPTASAWSGPVLTSSPHQRFYILLFALPWRFSCTPALLTSCRYSAQVEGTAGRWHFYVLPAGFSLPMLEALGRLTKSSKRVTTELDWTLGALGGIPGATWWPVWQSRWRLCGLLLPQWATFSSPHFPERQHVNKESTGTCLFFATTSTVVNYNMPLYHSMSSYWFLCDKSQKVSKRWWQHTQCGFDEDVRTNTGWIGYRHSCPAQDESL